MNSKRGLTLVVVGGVAVGLLAARYLYQMYKRYQLQKDTKTAEQLVKLWEPVGTVSALYIYPVKSCHRVEVDEADCQSIGIVGANKMKDRCLMVVNENNNFLHARIHPEMVLIKPTLCDDSLTLNAPDMEPISINIPAQPSTDQNTISVKVWGEEVPAVDCGDTVAAWLSRYIFKKDSGARLVYYPHSYTSREVKTKSVFPWMKKSDGAVFQDLAPYLLISEESVADLNSRLESPDQVSMLNFRPTIAVSGCLPYQEDSWTFIKIGEDATFRSMKPCDRCVLTTVDPKTGIKHPQMEPLRTLRKYRLAEDAATRKIVGESPFFGMNFALEKHGRICNGDTVYVGRF